ncbi:MAG: hypothetical protein A2Z91_08545 [Deltaproteobacteria bacterium GWA2_38_16]|nr:MAG: hypothetical protein A2Z91_08545 [Deltaproteobacteria bacterium GWA2_38_16]OGQ03842.1 MAG: hypothetical protein A3D19_07110 [Deltaproteobacteria bacterium RIFCSPHIGHO2_02_FULL_38_15]OGQ31501.1 MAG: hypothetical protein A3A72_09200 [Deltaproteobacteria bacterium RIFCSPLOWO2_01_FULL_38_9]OGQ63917.1 MAG: hypothetical protein A3G92_08010 [Deltaproteobacteria bacterium RIFCSPLOWO2_12_FULL_38_8]
MIDGKCKLFISIGVLFLFLSCGGGFQSIEKLEKIEPPKDIESAIRIEPAKKPSKKTKTVFQVTRQLSAFETKEAKKRAKQFSHLNVFRVGEKVTMALTWFAIKAGDVTLEVHPFVYVGDRKTYHFVGTAKTSGAMNLIHSVDDSIESYVDQETFYPYKAELHGKETDRIREGLVLFDYITKNIEYWMKVVHVKKGIKEKRRTDPFVPGVIDIFTSAFYLRAQDLKVGEIYHAEVYNAGKRITVDAEVLRKEKLETEIGEFDTLVVRPIAKFEGILQTSGDSTIWVTDDDRHFVLQLETKIKIGYVVAKLKKIEDSEYQLPKKE